MNWEVPVIAAPFSRWGTWSREGIVPEVIELISSWTGTRIQRSIPQASEASFPGALLFRSTSVVENTCIWTVYFSKTVLPSSLSRWRQAYSATHTCVSGPEVSRASGELSRAQDLSGTRCQPCQPCPQGPASRILVPTLVDFTAGVRLSSLTQHVVFLNGSPQWFWERVATFFSQVYLVFWSIGKRFKVWCLVC